MGRSLFAVSEYCQAPRILACQRVGRDRAGGSGADSCDFASMSGTDGSAGFGIKQNHQPLMRLYSASKVFREDADELRAENGTLSHARPA